MVVRKIVKSNLGNEITEHGHLISNSCMTQDASHLSTQVFDLFHLSLQPNQEYTPMDTSILESPTLLDASFFYTTALGFMPT